MRPRKPTAKQVAYAAGVSLAAVSRAFAPNAPLDKEKRKRILAAADKLGYVSPARRTAEAITAGTVTLVAGDFSNPFYPMVLDSLSRKLQLSNRQLLVYALPSPSDVDRALSQILAARPKAVIVSSTQLTSSMARACRQHGIKIVFFNRTQSDGDFDSVTCDNYAGGRDIAQYLIAKGRRRIGFVGGIRDTSTHRGRARGFQDALKEAGHELHCQFDGAFDYRIGYQAATAALSGPTRPDALFCCNDVMALAAIDYAREKGLSVPDDVAIVGFDDIPMGAWRPYRLTTVRQPVEQMMDEAIDMIDAAADNKNQSGAVVRSLRGKLIVRSSA
ncbi:MAG: LacI family DNA-binding transcriptional regulator [Mesorhizobium sp.]|uniref:LacI family DNA-binding transcriptional regulator n=1 Tax=Mesorhizobium sp. TaxID=1871066 RepID=UPI000FE5C417|nr:substrate-binding domain-containing protein [Mesorhizobium sp.]RWI54714.1 MAG: LacI family DNA-binding transcriptional regulator [Mesorhizobium sp.]